MKVSLVGQTVGMNIGMSGERMIVYCARVSNPMNQMNSETDARLIQYLIKNQHWSPFEMVDMCVEIETSRAISQQILRHRSFSFQEFSQRYAGAAGMGFQVTEARAQASKNRQSSTEKIVGEDQIWWQQRQEEVWAYAVQQYQTALAKGIAKEQARMLLPLGTTTRLYMKGSVRSWIHYLQLRLSSHTQQEHREVAQAIELIFQSLYPTIHQIAILGDYPEDMP